MAPRVPEEVDVFTVPHSRMKELVDDYFHKMQTTNFSDYVDMDVLIQTLFKTFREFKSHERIENKLIMKKLKNKIKQCPTKKDYRTVCNCHKDSQLTDIMKLLRDGYTRKTAQDRINFGIQLRKTLEDFTQHFLPHMKEEEEVFQPLLLEYFTYEELKELKAKVITQHIQQNTNEALGIEKWVWSEGKEHESSESEEEDSAKAAQVSNSLAVSLGGKISARIHDLPVEVMIKIFGHLNPKELVRCSQVSRQWSSLAMDPILWRNIHPVLWAKGDWVSTPYVPSNHDEEEEDGDGEGELEEEYVVIDDDADVDESASNEEECCTNAMKQLRNEAQVLVGVAKHVLPKVGSSVQTLNLANSKAITNGLLNKMLQSCANLEHLDLSQTKISDAGLKSIGTNGCGSRLKSVVLSGTVNITDATLIRLAKAQQNPPSEENLSSAHDRKTERRKRRVAKCCKTAANDSPGVTLDYDNESTNHLVSGLSKLQLADNRLGVDGYLGASDDGHSHPVQMTCSCTCQCRESAKRGSKWGYDDGDGACTVDTLPLNGSVNQCRCGYAHAAGGSGDWSDPACSEQWRDLSYAQLYCLKWCQFAKGHGVKPIEECADFWCHACGQPSVETQHCDTCSERDTCTNCGRGEDKDASLDLSPLPRTLQHLDLSGCFQITDYGIRALTVQSSYPKLRYLDLSGCLELSAEGLFDLVDVCPKLEHENIFYCDNIIDGPHAETASGCRNLECRSRVCCRSGH